MEPSQERAAASATDSGNRWRRSPAAKLCQTGCEKHASECQDCEDAVDELLASRALLSALPRQAEVGPWFAPRVMAAIAARESELRRSIDTWVIVPKLARRLTWVSALALVLASTWLFGRPASTPSTPAATDITGEPVHENTRSGEQRRSLAESGGEGIMNEATAKQRAALWVAVCFCWGCRWAA